MVVCPACHAKAPDGADACPRCGIVLPKVAPAAPAPAAMALPGHAPIEGLELEVPDLDLPLQAASPQAHASPAAPPRAPSAPARPPSTRPAAPKATDLDAGGGRNVDEDLLGAGLGGFELDLAEAPAPPASAVSNPRLPQSGTHPSASSEAMSATSPNGAGPVAPAPSTSELPQIDPREARAYAGHEDAPEAFWLWPIYAFKVTRRRLEMANELSTMRRAFPLLAPGPAAEEQGHRIAVAEAAQRAHDARAFVWGWTLAIGGTVLFLVILFFPLLYRLVVHTEPPSLAP